MHKVTAASNGESAESLDATADEVAGTTEELRHEDTQGGGEGDVPEMAEDRPRTPLVYSSPLGLEHAFGDVARAIAQHRGRPLLVLSSGFIDHRTASMLYKLRKPLTSIGRDTSFDVLLHSPGGDLTSCYRVARLLARFTCNWEALVPQMAASGATLISLGSSNIVLSDFAQLGPLDPQVMSKRTTKFFMSERQSPLEAFQAVSYLQRVALQTLDTTMRYLLGQQGVAPQTAVETASKIAVELTKPIFDKIEPYDLGSFAQDNGLALDYCRRVSDPFDASLASQRGANYKDLVEKYTAHEFFVDTDEAVSLGLNTNRPSEGLEDLFEEFRGLSARFPVEDLVGVFMPEGVQGEEIDVREITE